MVSQGKELDSLRSSIILGDEHIIHRWLRKVLESGKCVLLSVYAFGCLWMYVGVSLRMGVHPCVTVCVKENTSTSICAYVHAND